MLIINDSIVVYATIWGDERRKINIMSGENIVKENKMGTMPINKLLI